MDDMPETSASPTGFDPIRFTLAKPMASPEELAIAFGQLIDGICDLTGTTAARVITPSLSSVTISWKSDSIPPQDWLDGVEDQLKGFAACTGVHVWFRRH
jgi:hypothetical protein